MEIMIQAIHPISLFILIFLIGSLIVFYFYRVLLTYGIIIINFIVFLISLVFSNAVIGDLAFRPLYLSLEQFPQLYTLFSSMFLHSTQDIFHIVFNTLMFILIAPHFETHIGKKKFLAVYLITGIGAAMFHAVLVPLIPSPFPFDPSIGLIGASGAISGIIGAYAVAYPRDRVFFPVGFFIMRIPVLFAGVLFLGIQSIYVFLGGDPSVAYLAHIGGFLTGVILSALLIRPTARREEEQMITSPFASYKTSETPVKKIDFKALEKLAYTKKEKMQLQKIQEESVPEVRDAWIEHFLENIRCPVCQKPLHHQSGRVWCEDKHFEERY